MQDAILKELSWSTSELWMRFDIFLFVFGVSSVPLDNTDDAKFSEDLVRTLRTRSGCLVPPRRGADKGAFRRYRELLLERRAWTDRGIRLNKDLNLKVQILARAELPSSSSLSCMISYTTTKDGKVLNIKFSKRSNNSIFDLICLSAVQSIEDNPLYAFPEGTRYGRSEEMTSLKYSGLNSNCVADSPKLSDKEMQRLMKFSPDQIQELLKLSPHQLHHELDTKSD